MSPSLSLRCWCLCLPLSVKLAIQSVRCHSAPPVMAVPINVFLCRTAHYRHRYYTALLMALSDGLFKSRSQRQTGDCYQCVCVRIHVCVYMCMFQSQASRVSSGNKRPPKYPPESCISKIPLSGCFFFWSGSRTIVPVSHSACDHTESV